MYDTSDCVASASEYGCDVSATTLVNALSSTTSCEETIFVY